MDKDNRVQPLMLNIQNGIVRREGDGSGTHKGTK